MLIAICGRYLNVLGSSMRGNGKTLSAVYLAYLEFQKGKKIYTNFYTSFSTMYKMNDLIQVFGDNRLHDCLVIIDEGQVYLNNSGVSVKTRKSLITNFIAQTRKADIDIIITTQRFMQLHKELREQTDVILLATKYHYNKHCLTEVCKVDNCTKDHAVRLFNMNTGQYLPYILDCKEIGKLYNSNEIVLDTFEIQTKQ